MDAINRVFVTYLVNAAWQIPAIAVIFALCARPMHRLPTVYRHHLWVAALFASFLASFVTGSAD